MNEYDIVIIGGGVSGISAARRAIEEGASVCMIEKEEFNGDCYARALLPPFKIWLSSNKDENVSLDLLRSNAQDVVNSRISQLIESGVVIKKGIGSLVSQSQVRIEMDEGEEFITAGKIIIATGSRAKPIVNFPLNGETIISSDEVCQLKEIPESILVVSGEKTGAETASLLKRFGGKVILCHAKSRVLSDQDPELSIAFEEGMKRKKIKLLLERNIQSIFKDSDKIDVTLDGGVKFSVKLIVFVGERLGNIDGLMLEPAGIRVGDNGEIWVNDGLETSTPGVFAIGSVTGRCRSSSNSEEEGRLAILSAIGKGTPVNKRHIPYIVYSQPDVASVGCYASEAHEFGFHGIEGKFEFESNNFSDKGFVKVAVDKRTGKVIGAQIYGDNASEIISLATLAVKKGFSVKTLAQMSCGWASPDRRIQEAARSCLMSLKE
ncbi:MAG: dihydrolipoyl dehydrogenase family protein [Nitrospinales bacterium]